jgi:ketosteroid isomerase-like protein
VPLSFLGVVLALAVSEGRMQPDPLPSLVAAERAFSRASVERGMRDAFLENLAEDGIVFNPLPVNGKQVWEPRPRSPATLIWEPAFAEVSAAGDLGYTTGPWELRPPEGETSRPTLHGHFHSVWRRAEGGPWKVAVDIGGAHAPTEPGVGSGAFTAGPAHRHKPGADVRRASEREILAAERRFARQAESVGFAAAFAAASLSAVRLSREGQAPAVGLEAARAMLAGDAARARWIPQGSGASRSGDLGYAFGIRERLSSTGSVADTSAYLDVWRREAGRWRLALAVDNPVTR